MSIRKAFENQVSTQLDQWEKEIKQMEASAEAKEAEAAADEAKAETQKELYGKIDSLRKRVNDTRNTLKELADSGDEAWESLKGNVEKAVSDIKGAFK